MSDFDPNAFLAEPAAPEFSPEEFLRALPPSIAGKPNMGGAMGGLEAFTGKAAEAVPLGRLAANIGETGVLQLAKKAFGVGKSGVQFTPEALAEAQRRGLDVPKDAIPGVVDTYRGVKKENAGRMDAASEQRPWLSGLGTGVGTALSLAAPLPKVGIGGKAATMGQRILSNALTAAGYGALNSAINGKADLTHGEVLQTLKDTVGIQGIQNAAQDWSEGNKGRAILDVMGAGGLGGALTGGVIGGAVEAARRPLSAALEGLKSLANRKALNALGAMKPELNKLGSEQAQRLGEHALESGVVSPLASRATMAQRIEDLRQGAGGKISDALSELDALANSSERIQLPDAAQKIEALADQMGSQPALKNVADKFRAQAEAIRKAPGGAQTLQDFEANIARPYKQTTNWNADLALPKETLKKLPRALEGHVEEAAKAIADRTGSDALERYMAGKKDYGKLAGLADIAEEGIKRQASNHSFGLKDVMTGAAGLAAGAHHGTMGSLATGGGALLAAKLANRFGDQLTATGANKLANLGNSIGSLISETPASKPGQFVQFLIDALRDREAPQLTLTDLVTGKGRNPKRQGATDALAENGGQL